MATPDKPLRIIVKPTIKVSVQCRIRTWLLGCIVDQARSNWIVEDKSAGPMAQRLETKLGKGLSRATHCLSFDIRYRILATHHSSTMQTLRSRFFARSNGSSLVQLARYRQCTSCR